MKFYLLLFFCILSWLPLVKAVEETSELEFEDFNEADRLFVSVLTVQLVPEESDVVFAKSGGVFRLFQASGSPVQKDEVWGVLNLKELELERSSYEVEVRAFPE